jgi:2-polyprenyl-3-methyl-5-hydroxy-6-metoxy-1,4-benzoquinol methylase
MKQITLDAAWPTSWKDSFRYDAQEIYQQISCLGYVYAYWNRLKHTIEAVQHFVPPGGKILDLAAAQGNFTLTLAERGYEVTWNDLREELAGYVALKHEKGVVEYRPGNAFDLEFPYKFDAVLITEIIEHVAHPDQFLRKVAGLVVPNGHIIMTTPNGEYFRNHLPKFSDCPDPSQFENVQFQPNSDGHIFLLHTDELSPLASQADLSIRHLELFTNSLTNGHVKTETLLKILPRSFVNLVERLTAQTKGWVSRKLNVHMLAVFQKK